MTSRLETWHDAHDEAIDQGYDRSRAVHIADEAVLLKYGRDWGELVMEPGAMIEVESNFLQVFAVAPMATPLPPGQ